MRFPHITNLLYDSEDDFHHDGSTTVSLGTRDFGIMHQDTVMLRAEGRGEETAAGDTKEGEDIEGEVRPGILFLFYDEDVHTPDSTRLAVLLEGDELDVTDDETFFLELEHLLEAQGRGTI